MSPIGLFIFNQGTLEYPDYACSLFLVIQYKIKSIIPNIKSKCFTIGRDLKFFNFQASFTFTLKQIKFYQPNSQHKLHPKTFLTYFFLSIHFHGILNSHFHLNFKHIVQVSNKERKSENGETKKNQATSPYHHFVITTIILHSSILLLHSSWMNKNKKIKNLLYKRKLYT